MNQVKSKTILGIESSCDETACAILQKDGDRVTILSNIVASSAKLQEKYGGVIPEQAAREQLRSIIPVIEQALNQAFPKVIPSKEGIYTDNYLYGSRRLLTRTVKPGTTAEGDDRVKKIDAVAVTYGPGLIGSLLVGVETAKTLATVWKKPLIPINHLVGHFYANWITDHLPGVKAHPEGVIPKFPCIGLLVSGGHTDLLLFTGHGKYEYLGGTRDDAAGECFDKCARLLGLPYPGGPAIAKLAASENPNAFDLPRPMIDSKDFDFSFSGLKTAVANLVHTWEVGFDSSQVKADLAASIEQAIVDVLVAKTVRAAQIHNVEQIIVAGGVAANQKLKDDLRFKINNLRLKIKLFIPPAELCTDNAAMIAAAAFYNFHPINPLKLQADPNLNLANN